MQTIQKKLAWRWFCERSKTCS